MSEKIKTETTETADVVKIEIEEEEKQESSIIKLSKKYNFEGKIIDTIDLSKIKDMTTMEMQTIEHLYRKTTKNVASSPEVTLDYAIAAASVLTDLPIEFLKRISAKDAIKIKNRVINFLYSED